MVDSIAPEDIRFSPGARDEDKASFLGFIKRATSSELVELGLREEEIDYLGDRSAVGRGDRAQRGRIDGNEHSGEGDSEHPLWLCVAYIRADDDGDGVSELLRVVYAHGGRSDGSGRWPHHRALRSDGPASIALATPILMPHALIGRCLFDQVKDLQQLGSVITRSLLDNLYLVNRPDR